MITIGVCSWKLDAQGVSAIQRASELGYKAIELLTFSQDDYNEIRNPADQAAYVEAASTYEIELVGMVLGIFSSVVALHSVEQESTAWEMLSNMIDVAIAMKIPVIACAMFGEYGINSAEEMARTSAMLRRGCEYIGDRPLKIATGSELSIEDNRKLIEQVNHPNMRTCYNANNWSGVNGVEMVRELGDVLYNVVHYRDFDLEEGSDDYRATAQALKDIGFEGYILSHIEHKDDIEAQTAADITKLKHIFEL
jgi:sugar phosphate isomerase/epimerase